MMKNTLVLTLMLTHVNAGLCSKAWDEQPETTCIPCSYMELEDADLCFPEEKKPHGSKWRCHPDARQNIVEDGVWDCLLTGTDSTSCTDATKGACIWCAEPVYGLCVTPEIAAKLGYLPFFDCDSTIMVAV
jgi:hypothetical protein